MTETALSLTNCDREPIHIPGSIQPYGALLACDASASVVLRYSVNAPDLLGAGPKLCINAALEDIIGAEATHDLRNALSTSTDPARPSLLFGIDLGIGRGRFDVAAHTQNGSAILEFEPVQTTSESAPLDLTRTLVTRLKQASSATDLVRKTARLTQAMFGYDRVMIYQFAHDGSGQVVSEAKRDHLESFLGQHFPASDIPQQARLLYLRNTIRMVGDANAKPVPIEPVLDASGEPLDLSYAHLRSVSPIHCEYLRNMGVAASMSVSVIVGGELWGLIACHHYSPRRLSIAQRVAAEMFGEFFSLHLEALTRQERLDTAATARRALDGLLRNTAQSPDFAQVLREKVVGLKDLVRSDGVGIWINGVWTQHGSTPPARAIQGLARFIGATAKSGTWGTHGLSRHFPSAEAYADAASGVLAIPLSQRPRDYLLFFRREVLQTVEWAGDPEKTYETGVFGDRLTPRKSFAIWKQTVERQSIPWTAAERETAETVRSALVEVIIQNVELLQEERARAEVRQRMLNEELNHRVKNILAIITSLVSHPVEAGKALEDFVDSLKGRIQALAFAHDQIVRGEGGGTLRALLDAELSPYRSHEKSIQLEGPTVSLDARAYSVMALVLHELATNAAKYGALSTRRGHLTVKWSQSEEGGCDIVWTESGGPAVTPPTRTGFGSILVDRAIPHDLGGESQISFLPGGVEATFFIPARHTGVSSDGEILQEPVPAPETPLEDGSASLDGLKVLLLEDQLLVAMSVEAMLADHGASLVETVSSVESARRKLQAFHPDVAVLDLNLGAELSVPIAHELHARRIPFVFATGYGEANMIPPEFRNVSIVRKPYSGETIAEALKKVARR